MVHDAAFIFNEKMYSFTLRRRSRAPLHKRARSSYNIPDNLYIEIETPVKIQGCPFNGTGKPLFLYLVTTTPLEEIQKKIKKEDCLYHHD